MLDELQITFLLFECSSCFDPQHKAMGGIYYSTDPGWQLGFSCSSCLAGERNRGKNFRGILFYFVSQWVCSKKQAERYWGKRAKRFASKCRNSVSLALVCHSESRSFLMELNHSILLHSLPRKREWGEAFTIHCTSGGSMGGWWLINSVCVYLLGFFLFVQRK